MFFFLYGIGVLLFTSYVLRLHSSAIFFNIFIIYQKKKKWRKILTLDNLRKMNIIVVVWCCMYKKCGESIDHLLLRCEVTTEWWSVHFQLFGVAWVMP